VVHATQEEEEEEIRQNPAPDGLEKI